MFRPIARCLDGQFEMGQHACATLNALLHKCSAHLEELEVQRDSALIWPMEDVAPLPELKRLVLGGTQVDNRALSKLLTLSPKLHYLHFEEVRGMLAGMRSLLDAIRDHPSRMMLEWDYVPSNVYPEFGAHFNTAHASSAKKVKAESNSRPDVRLACKLDLNRSLQNYVAGKGRWNKTLRVEYEYGATDGEDSEDEEAQS